MKVKDLIIALEALDGDAIVVVEDNNYGLYQACDVLTGQGAVLEVDGSDETYGYVWDDVGTHLIVQLVSEGC